MGIDSEKHPIFGEMLLPENIEYPEAYHKLEKNIAKKILMNIFCNAVSIRNFEDMFDYLRMHSSHQQCQDVDISLYFKAALSTINYLSTEDPSQLHFHAARETLKDFEEGALESNEKARDLLARQLVTECNRWASVVIPKQFLQENVPESRKTLSQSGRINTEELHLVHSINGRLWLDELFIQHISKIGIKGKSVAEEFSKVSQKWYSKYLFDQNVPDLYKLWVDIDREPYYCRYIKMLSDILWEDVCSSIWNKEKKFVPAIPKGFWLQTIKPTLLKSSKIQKSEDQVSFVGETGKIAISVKIPFLDKKSLDLITRGIGSLGSLTGHRALRWEIKNGCQNAIDGVPDPRVLVTEGGYEGIANLIGCGKSPARISETKSILYAQANANFHMPNGDKTSSLIILQEMEHHRNGEPSKIKIILGDLLLPHSLFSLPKNEQRLLIPITDLPPLIGSPNTFAAQAMLQLLILEEFSKQSDRLSQKGSVFIDQKKWNELANEALLKTDNVKEVIKAWCSNSINGIAFLKQDGDEFTISNDHPDVLHFLEEQGKKRVIGSQKGFLSAKNLAKKKNKILKEH